MRFIKCYYLLWSTMTLYLFLCHGNAFEFSIDRVKMFNEYILRFNKSYIKGSDEYTLRFQNFLMTLDRLDSRNNLQKFSLTKNLAQYGFNKFSDLSPEEFNNMYLSSLITTPIKRNKDLVNTRKSIFGNNIPKKLDWRKKGIVTSVKNQEACGGCWAFSAVEAIESAWALAGNKLVSLSTQQIIDCCDGTYGCSGGSPCLALEWIKKKDVRIVKSSVYPFQGAAGQCRNVTGKFGVGVLDYFCETCWGECPSVEMSEMLPKLFSHGPLSVSVDALSWQDYVGGIIRHHCSYDSPNHSVQIVGYDLTGKTPYWIVRNSWGSDFGEQGYLYIKLGENLCGIANSYAGIVTVYD